MKTILREKKVDRFGFTDEEVKMLHEQCTHCIGSLQAILDSDKLQHPKATPDSPTQSKLTSRLKRWQAIRSKLLSEA